MDWTTLGRRYARLATETVVRRPALWRLFRGPLRMQFERLAPTWSARCGSGRNPALEQALAAVGEPPRRALDIGSGTGVAAVLVARRWPDVEVIGVDLAAGMVAEARRTLPAELSGRVRFERADAARLRGEDGSFDLVVLANAIPFFDELSRVTAPGGSIVFSFSHGAETPIFVPPERLRRELARRNFVEFAEFSAGGGLALLARSGRAS